MPFFLKKKKQHKRLWHKGLMVLIFGQLEWFAQCAEKLQQNIIELRAVIAFKKLFHSLAQLRISCSQVLIQREFMVILKCRRCSFC